MEWTYVFLIWTFCVFCLCEMDRSHPPRLACYVSDKMTKFVFWSVLLELNGILRDKIKNEVYRMDVYYLLYNKHYIEDRGGYFTSKIVKNGEFWVVAHTFPHHYFPYIDSKNLLIFTKNHPFSIANAIAKPLSFLHFLHIHHHQIPHFTLKNPLKTLVTQGFSRYSLIDSPLSPY